MNGEGYRPMLRLCRITLYILRAVQIFKTSRFNAVPGGQSTLTDTRGGRGREALDQPSSGVVREGQNLRLMEENVASFMMNLDFGNVEAGKRIRNILIRRGTCCYSPGIIQ